MQDLKWENNVIELEFSSNLSRNSFKPKEVKPIIKGDVAKNVKLPVRTVAGFSPRPFTIHNEQAAATVPFFDRSLKPVNDRPKSTGAIPKVIKGKVVEPLPPVPKKFEEFELLENLLDASGVIFNFEAFNCLICFSEIGVGVGVTLRDCLHNFCRECLMNTIHHSDDAMVKCPFVNDDYACEEFLQSREVRAIVSKEGLEKHLALGLKMAEIVIAKTFHCKTPNCIGFCEYEEGANLFECPVCNKNNCIECDMIHPTTCYNYKMELQRIREAEILRGIELERQNDQVRKDRDEAVTKTVLQTELTQRKVMHCPRCQALVMKISGCAHIVCLLCKHTFNWVNGDHI